MAQEIYHRSEWGNPNEQWGNVYLNADLTNELYKRASEYENSWVTDQLLNRVGTKPSIILTPTAYEDGVLNSVKPVQSLGSELITNGDFATDSNWNRIGTWSISSGQASANANSQSQYLQQDFSITNSKVYKFTYEIIENTLNGNGASLSSLGGFGSVPLSNVIGYHTEYITASNQSATYALKIGVSGTATSGKITIDNVSVKEVTDADFDFTRGSSATRVNSQGLIEDVQILSSNLVQNGDFSQEGAELVTNGDFATDSDWDKLSGATISSGQANLVFNGLGNPAVKQNIPIIQGKTYKIVFNVSRWVSGKFEVYVSGDTRSGFVVLDGVGQYEVILKINTVADVRFVGNGAASDFSIDNVSVKEVGQNWNLSTGWSIGDGVANAVDAAFNSQLVYSDNVVANTKYKISFDVSNYVKGNVRVNIGNVGSDTVSSNGNFTFVLTSANVSPLIIQSWAGGSGTSLSITNLSVIEITEDTNLPRIDYTDGVGSWLFEPQSTNTITSSNSGFLAFNMDLAYNNATSPDGTQNAFKATTTTASGSQFRPNQTITTPSTFSIFLKYGNNQWYQVINSSANSFYANIDVQNGVFGSSGSQTDNLSVKDYGNGWYRFSGTFTSASTNGSIRVYASSFPNAGWAGVSAPIGSYVYGYGFQVEASSFATSYIPTEGSIKTRLQDAAFGAGNSDLINSTEGVLYAEIATLEAAAGTQVLGLSDGSGANRISFQTGTVANQLRFVVDSGGNQASYYHILSDITDFNKVALKWKQDDFSFWVNGVKVATDTSGNVPPLNFLNTLDFYYGTGIFNFTAKTKCVAVFKEALTDEELTCLTTI